MKGKTPTFAARSGGFTLAELAVVVVIITLLLGGMIGTFSMQLEFSRINDTRKTLETAREALLGFAAANGRLPCPATATSNGVEAPVGGGTCTPSVPPGVGFVPAATLALTPVNNQGYLVDSWGRPIRYAVTNSPYPGCPTSVPPTAAVVAEFTTTGVLRTGLTDGCVTTPAPDLRVCTTATGIAGAACSGAGTTLTNNAVAVVFSIGKNGVTGGAGGSGGSGGTGLDELNNLNNDRVFIMHEQAAITAANGEFDDIVIWLSPGILYNRIFSGGL